LKADRLCSVVDDTVDFDLKLTFAEAVREVAGGRKAGF
jgi:hypothetical protein